MMETETGRIIEFFDGLIGLIYFPLGDSDIYEWDVEENNME